MGLLMILVFGYVGINIWTLVRMRRLVKSNTITTRRDAVVSMTVYTLTLAFPCIIICLVAIGTFMEYAIIGVILLLMTLAGIGVLYNWRHALNQYYEISLI